MMLALAAEAPQACARNVCAQCLIPASPSVRVKNATFSQMPAKAIS
jgi:hypothetical protein